MDEIAADWILQNGCVITLDPRRPAATALAIAGGRIVATGGGEDVRAWRGRRTRVVDLGGASVIPGLVDAHAHLDREGLKQIFPTLERCRSIADIQATIRRQRSPGEWIVTMPVGVPPFYLDPPAGLAEGGWPTRADLDLAAPHHPVYTWGIWGYWNKPPVHSIANTLALTRAGIGRDTVPPPGIEIVKDAAGEPTGLFVEHNLIQVIEFTLMKAVPRFTPDDRLRALRAGGRGGGDERLRLTVGGAWITFAERERGVLAPGRAADLAVLDHDPLAAPLDTLAETRARLTMVAGRLVDGDA